MTILKFRFSLLGILLFLTSQILTSQTFTEQAFTLTGVSNSSVAWGDYDNDGDLDILLTGYSSSEGYISKIYRNDAGVFTDIIAGLPGVGEGSSVAWGDYDNDGDLDILLTGYNNTEGYISKIYSNNAGVFTDINAGLPGVENGGAIAWGDYDNDGDLDILLTGYASGNYISKIYHNDSGVFSAINAGLTGVSNSSVAWGDYDNDGDLDILLAGYNDNVGLIAKVYSNNNGVFTDIDAGLEGMFTNSVSWGDYDNDGDLDILMAGYSWYYGYISRIYRNESGVFTDINAGLTGVDNRGSLAWGDYDNDGDLDILLTGYSSSGDVSKIYSNDAGVFTDIIAGLTGVNNSSVAWGDYDNDGDLDILLTGYNNTLGSISIIYLNNAGTANTVPAAPANLNKSVTGTTVTLTWDKSTDTQTTQKGLSYNLYIGTASATGNTRSPMANIADGYRRIADKSAIQNNSWTIKKLAAGTYYWSVQAIDNCFAGSAFATEGSFIIPFSNSLAPVADQKLTINQTCATLTVTESSTPSSRQWKYSTVDGGSYNQTITGTTGTTCSTSFPTVGIYYIVCESTFGGTVYTSNQVKIVVSNFIDQTGIGLTGVQYSSAAWGDYDNDGDLDILLTGYNNTEGNVSKIYNNLAGDFTDIAAGLTGVQEGFVAWGDYDNDNDLDILLTGSANSGYISIIYNNNAGIFTDINAGLEGVGGRSSAAWGDYDNDGDQDIILTGNSNSGTITKIYRNDAGIFTDINTDLTGARLSSVAWGDYDNDGDLDLLLCGYNETTYGFSKIYRNDNGAFININAGLYANPNASVEWGDYDNDGDLDVLLAVSNVIKIYNNSNGTFSEISASFPNNENCKVAWGDYDNDGDLDLLMSGNTSDGIVSKIFQNNNGAFTEIPAYLDDCQNGSVAWGDYDNDGDLDILLTGSSNTGLISKIYKNYNAIPNTAPTAPSNLAANVTGGGVSLSWTKATDNQTLQPGLSYNLYIGSAAGTVDRKSPMAALPEGYRRIVQKGLIQGNAWSIERLPAGTYFWNVQAIDNSFAGSAFATEGSFTIPFSNSIAPIDEQILLINQSGSLLTATESVPAASRQWKYSTVSGGPYDQIISGAAGITYTPNFPAFGTYYVVCDAIYNTITYTSNEVKISVPAFTEQTGISLSGVTYSSVAWGDYDNNGDLDILLTGYCNTEGPISKIYSNIAGVFTDITAGLPGVRDGFAAWGDYDNDNDLDILITGYNYSEGYISKIYRNDDGVFTDIIAGLTGVTISSFAWGDYDNDGDLDILLTGYTGSGDISTIYRNDAGVFTDINAGLPGIEAGSVAWGDYDNDGDLDILLAGNWISKIFRNDNGIFTDINAGLSGVSYYVSVAWGDYDNDGDLDILLSGGSISVIYQNTNGIFTDISAELPGLYDGCSAAWGDYDNDGDLDIILTGRNSTSGTVSSIFRNDSGVFTDINAGLTGIQYGSVAWGDYDNDSDLDILLTGTGISKVLKNNTTSPNTIPTTPSNLNANLAAGGGITLSWDKATDTQTLQNGLSYNLYIGTAPATVDKKSPMAELPGGYRRIVRKGLIQSNTWTIKRLTAGTYSWSVQAIDNSFAGSAFATEGTFNIQFSNSIAPVTEQTLAISENGSVLTVTESPASASRQWKYSTVSGGPYDQVITGETGATYTPNFSALGAYYVVCESVYNTVAYTSNEVKINVLAFSEQTGISLSGVRYSSVAWGDYDDDGDQDILLTGYNNTEGYISKIYNNLAGVFTDIDAGLTGVYQSSVAWGDYDNDNDLDILLTGSSNSGYISKIYRNDAGVFTDIIAGLTGVYNSSVAWGDYDNDGDLDILLTGQTDAGNISKIYRNDAGVFTDINAGLIGIYRGSVAWGDYDNDGDLDILLTGSGYSKIYRNDNGIFIDINAGLSGVYSSSVAWGDYDNDGDLDILLTGDSYSKIYNNNAGVFTDIDAGLPVIYQCSVSWGDYDNDGDLDILFTGYNGTTGYISRVYRNDAGVFTDMNAGLTGVRYSSVAWGDYDGDGDLDILLTGYTGSVYISKIYKNNISAVNSVPVSPANLQASVTGTVVTLTWDKATDTQTQQNGLSYNLYIGTAAGTVDKRSPMAALPDGYRKIVRKGIIQSNTWTIKRLTAGTYYWSVQAIDNSFAGSAFPTEGSFNIPFSSSVSPVDEQTLASNQDGAVLTVTESPASSSRQWKYSTVSGGPYSQAITGATGTTYTPNFSNLGTYFVVCESVYNTVTYTSNEVKINVLMFSEQTGISLSDVNYSSVAWGDYDNDGDQDILLTGNSTSGYISKIYNNNAGVFTDINAGLTGVYLGSVAWGDYDNDNDLDILLTGYVGSSNYAAKIYRNDAGVFTDIIAGLTGVYNSSVAWGDYDNDGDLDILLTGSTGSVNISKIYRNDAGVFTDINAVLTGVSNSSVAWGDYDGDGDLDILLTGSWQSIIYRNDNSIFTDINANLTGISYGSVAWGDYDNDGDLDILLTGGGISKIYRNDAGVFTDIWAGLTGAGERNSVAWGDYDNDGDLDILLTGYVGSSNYISKVYRNEAGVFTDINAGLTGVYYSSVAWGDYDGDGDLDILLTGTSGSGYLSKIYKNNITAANSVPTAPSNLQSSVTGTGITLSWNKATDAQTLQNGLSYNLYIGAATGTVNKRSPMAALPGGYRRIVGKGIIQSNTWTIKRLPAGTYYWSVQAIDNSFAGSSFPTEGTFTVPFSNSVSPIAEQTLVLNQDGSALTVTESVPAASRQWKYSTVSGGPYNQAITGATAITYTPNFSAFGTYYVVCEAVYNAITYTSNEVKINVPAFTEQTGISLSGVYYGSVAWGDYDNDGDQDFLLTGNSSSDYISIIYRNDTGVFTDINAGLTGVGENSSIAWGDYDNDGDLDILLTGYTSSSTYISKIYRNDNNGIFTDIIAGLTGVAYSSVAWGDYDNDGDQDILLTGYNGSGDMSKIYRNDAGVFSDINAVLPGIEYGSVAWGDYDNDGDLDILLAGNGTSKIYRNDNGSFTDINAGLTGMYYSSVAWGDYDNDGDLDILLTGNNGSRIFRNDNGIFTDINAGLTSVYFSSVSWGDYDNDGDLDVLLTGSANSIIYRNDAGVFTDINAGLTGVEYSSVAWGDYDGDGDLDILLTGYPGSGYLSKIYRNNITAANSVPTAPSNLQSSVSGTGITLSWDKASDTQTLQNGLSYNLYIGTATGTVNKRSPMAALPGGYRRIVRKGIIQSNTWIIKRLTAGTYYWSVQAIDNSFAGSAFPTEGTFTIPFSSSVSPIDEQTLAINQDGSALTLTESSTPSSRQWKYSTVNGGPYDQTISGATGTSYTPNFSSWGTYYVVCESVYNTVTYTSNEVKINVVVFSEQTGISLSDVSYSSVAWGDYDNDGDQDILLTGYNSTEGYISKIYNNNAGVFTDINAGLTGVRYSSVAWGDYDNDNDLDILLTGSSNSGYISKIYRNDFGIFTDIIAGLAGVRYSSVAWGDYDNDGDLDILLTGQTTSANASIIYRNDNSVFTDINAGLTGIYRGSVAWGDYDNDGDLDILLTGSGYSRIYRNDKGVFTDINAGLTGENYSSAAWGDYDNDGDLDILMTGNSSSMIYRNESGIFTDIYADLPLIYFSSVSWGDYDNDGDLDILFTGYNSTTGNISSVYRNDAGVFSDIIAGLTGVQYGSVAWGDYDGDGDMDILLTGDSGSGFISKIYKNNITTANSAPTAPSNLQANVTGTGIMLSWNKATDTQTLQNGLSYNLYIGTAAGTVDKKSPMATLPGGYRKITAKGLIQGNTWPIKRLTTGTYSWSVQAIDNSFAGSAFPTEGTFTVPFSNSVSPFTDQTLAINQDGSPLTVTESPAATSRQWKYSTVRGGPYNQVITGETATTYTPNFSAFGTYFVICESVYNTIVYPSNEVKIIVPAFTEQTGISLSGVRYSSVAWGDYDNDGDQDILLTGYNSTEGYISKIYNNLAGVFTDIDAGLTGVYQSSVAWGDYDNDGDLDILLTGYTGSAYISIIYSNNAGVFTNINAGLTGVRYGSVAWGDYDNDGDLDILLTGQSDAGNISKIYRNDAGIFTDINAGLTGIYRGSVAWGDYDNDGDLDILLTGSGYSRIYRNDNGSFTDIIAGLYGVSYGSSAWGDYDNDGDLDILLTGSGTSRIYRNDNGIFNDISAAFAGVNYGSAAWGDCDNDGDLDILLTGLSGSDYISKVYRNDNGNFVDLNVDLTGVYYGSVAWGDYDNNGDLDILLTGYTGSAYISKIYKNNSTSPNTSPLAPSNLLVSFGSNKVTLSWNKPTDSQTSQNGLSYNLYVGTSAGTADRRSPMAAIPGGFRRIVQTGSAQSNTWYIKGLVAATYYWSVQAIDNNFTGSAFAAEGSFTVPFSSSIAPADDQMLATGQNSAVLTVTESSTPTSRQWKYSTVSGGPYDQSVTGATGTTCSPSFSALGIFYVVCESVKGGIAYNSNQVKITVTDFAEQAGTGLPGVYYGSAAWGDYDNDDDLDVLLTGYSSTGYISRVYNNDAGVYTDITAGLPGVYYGSAAWGDYDNDGDLDILLTGLSNTDYISIIYRNDGGVFNDINAGLTGVYQSSVAWGDYDNDGDLDILLTGYTGNSNYVSTIYRNDAGTFADINAGLTGVYNGSVAWGDFDNDSDLDILLTGSANSGNISNIYRNDNGIFTDINAGLAVAYTSSVAWGDYDNDGDLDILLTGYNGSIGYFSRVYRNDAGVFTDINAGLTGVRYSSVVWGDYDNDGDLDILLSGHTGSSYISSIFRNENGVFTDINAILTGVNYSSVAWGDYDNDGDLDILLTGNSTSGRVTKIYKNLRTTQNTVPAAPSNLQTSVSGTGVNLTWNKSTDTQTAQNGLSYNLYIGTSSGTVNKRSPMATLPGGYRKIVRKGDIQNNSWTIRRLPAGTYYWSVQAIDNTFAGSAFATQGSFTVAYSNSVSPSGDQIVSVNQSIATLTVDESSTPVSRQWKYSTVSGGPYNQIITGATGLTSAPSFSELGTYYVVCESDKGGITYISNQVKIIVTDFIPKTGISIPGVNYSSTAWGDYDNDGDLDLLLTGSSTQDDYISRIYRNDLGVYNDISAGLTGVYYGSVAWGDYDNDGDLDILITGDSDNGIISKIYNNDAGVFTDINAGLTGVNGSSVAWGDYDIDGDLDILLTGYTTGNFTISKVYRNDNGTFTDINAGLTGVYSGSATWGDYDNDGDPDILLTGSGGSFIYRNDNGIFTDIIAGLPSVPSGSAAWGDFDSDGDLDVLLSGSYLTKVFENNNGVFTEYSTSLPGVTNSSVAWGDYDGDGYLDILLTGSTSAGSISKIFLNNSGVFTEVFANLEGVYYGSVSSGDVDNDGDLDILSCGSGYAGLISKIYINNSLNQNSVPSAPSNLQVTCSSNKVTLTWDKSTDSETPQDGLSYNLSIGTATGSVNRKAPMAALPEGYRRIVQRGDQTNTLSVKNLTAGVYYWSVQSIDNSFAGSPFATESSFTVPYSNSISPAADQALVINQNGALLTVTESSAPASRQWKYATVSGGPYNQTISGATAATYTPNFSAWGTYYVVCESTKDAVVYTSNEVKIDVLVFSEQTDIGLAAVITSSVAWGDYDNDGDQDILLTGYSGTGNISKIYRNDAGVYTDINAGLPGIRYGSVAWGDYDNDGDLDILLTGNGSSRIYRNDNGIFTDISAGLTGVNYSSAAWGDYDNDGDLDILLTGSGISRIYRNTNGLFTDISAGLTGVSYGSAAWGDYDTDGDLDILLTGSSSSTYISKIYRNDSGIFTEISAGLTGVMNSSVAWGDVDNDGDLDILLTGYVANFNYVSKIYRNDNGIFPEINADLTGVYFGSAAWGDYDNDGDLDILISGRSTFGYISGIYRNDAGAFTDINTPLTGIYQGSVAWGDCDKDNDLDILITGYSPSSGYVSKIYRNNITTPNVPPSVPASLTTSVTGTGITLSWNKSTDSKTPQAGLSYNLYIGTTPSTVNRKSPMSSLTDGYRRIAQKGLIQKNTWSVKRLPVGTYYWSVQATDNSFAGSSFATEGTFAVLFTNSIGPDADQILAINQSGTALAVAESGTSVSRQWKYATVSGGPYNQTITGATGTSYTPVFADFGTYYIVCESVFNTVTYTSNEVKIRVPAFTEQTGISLPGVNDGSIVWGDYDNDGDKDLLLTGNNNTRIYSNNGGLFSDINAGLTGVYYSSAAWGDYDNDNDLDILISGYNSTSGDITKIYRNDAGIFTDLNAGLTGIEYGSASWGDYDNDGDLDVLLAGTNFTKIYRNDSGTFTDLNSSLAGVNLASAEWGDYDNDGDLDILLTGMAAPDPISKVYRNDNGAFTDISAGLTGVCWGSAAWGDYDSDGDLDILLTGSGPGSIPVSIIYKNDAGVFTDINAGLPGIYRGAVSWGDYDNDGDLDILFSGNYSADGISRIYRNDSGVFINIDDEITGVQNSSAAWCDYDNDGDIDFVVSGMGISTISRIYLNNALTANVVPSAPSNLQASLAANKVTLSWNKSTDTETLQNGLSYNLYIGTSAGSVNRKTPMASLPGGYQRIVQKGVQTSSWPVKNLSAGTYYWSVQAIDNSFAGSAFATEGSFTVAYSNSIAPVADQNLSISQTGSQLTVTESSAATSRLWKYSTVSGGPYDQVITGETGTAYTPVFPTAGTYYVVCESTKDAVAYTSNEVKVNVLVFVEQTSISLTGIRFGSVSWCDYDNDGDLDILISGYNPSGNITTIYRNDSGVFTAVNAGLTGTYQSSAAWGDYDNDGYVDLLLTGYIGSNTFFSKIYHNDAGVLTDINAGLPGVNFGSSAWSDYDNDGDLDILLTGGTGSTSLISRVYRNDNGAFTDINAGLTGLQYGSAAWGDYDNDGDPDILLTGLYYIIGSTGTTTAYASIIYRNDNGGFTDINAGLTGVGYSSSAWGDYDNDGDLDILLTGYYFLTGSTTASYISSVYRNDSGVFTDIAAGLKGVSYGSVAWGDYDIDGDLDILLSGNSGAGYISVVYGNDNGVFTDISAGLLGVNQSSSAWGDYDNDGDLDIILSGYVSSNYYTKIYKNFTSLVNTPPDAPTNLNPTAVSISKVNLAWDKAVDLQTPQNTLTYNIRIGTTAGAINIAGPMASESDGFRRIPARGNAEFNNAGYPIDNLSIGTYYWSVQAIDQSFAGGAWATEGSFTLLEAPTATDATDITQTTMTANWNSSAGATGYRLDVATDNAFSIIVTGYSSLDIGNNLSADITGLTANTTYYYRVYAYNAEGVSIVYSNVISANTLAIPPIPVATDATLITQTGFTANWGSSVSATGYQLDIATDIAFTTFVTGYDNRDVADVTSFSVTGLTSNTTYYYRIRAYSSGGSSNYSDTITVTTLPVPPAAPAGLSAVSCNDLVTLTWSANTETGFLRYRIYGGTTANPTTRIDSTATGTISATTITFSTLTHGQTYYFRVTAVVSPGVESQYSTSVSVLVKKGVIPRIKAKWGDLLICYNIGDSIASFQWYKETTAIASATRQYYVTNKQPASYYVQSTDRNGCINNSNTINISGTKSISVYPNPATTSFELSVRCDDIGKTIISLYNSSGVKVLEYQTEKTDTTELIREIPIAGIQTGTYTVEVSVNNKRIDYSRIVIVK